MQIRTREFYSSTNGDKWFLRHNLETDHVYVKHVANAASGGYQTDYELAAFLNGPLVSERAALSRLIADLADKAVEQQA